MRHQQKAEGTIGILAGGGPLPARLAASLQAQGKDVFLVGFEGFADRALLAPYPHIFVRLAAAGEILRVLRAKNCTDLVLLGPVKRPSWRDLRPDAEGARILRRLGRAIFGGDNGLLGALVRVMEEEGFRVRGAHEFLIHETGDVGPLGFHAPDAQALADIQQAVAVQTTVGPLDMGQACVVQNGLVLAVEALEGTDAMLERCGPLRQEGLGGVLLKMPKPGQELRADMPALGPETIRRAAQAGLRGVAFEAGRALLVERALCVAEADRLGLFLYGLNLPAAATSVAIPVATERSKNEISKKLEREGD